MIIEFLEPELPSRRAWTVVLAIAASAAVLFAVGQVLEARARALQAEARSAAIVPAGRPHAPPPTPPYAADARRAIDRAMLPEAPVLKELEMVAVAGIQLSSIDIDMAAHVATVELEAASEAALADYLDQLNAGFATPNWHVLRVAAGPGTATAVSVPLVPAVEIVTLARRF